MADTGKLTRDEENLLYLLSCHKFVVDHLDEVHAKLLLIPKEHIRVINEVLGDPKWTKSLEDHYGIYKKETDNKGT